MPRYCWSMRKHGKFSGHVGVGPREKLRRNMEAQKSEKKQHKQRLYKSIAKLMDREAR